MSQKRTITMQLTEPEIDAVSNAINTDREAAGDNLKDGGYENADAMHEEELYVDALSSVQTKLGEAWTDAHTMNSHAQQVMAGDWDANGSTSIHLPRAKAEDLLQRLGWTIEQRQHKDRPYRVFVAPGSVDVDPRAAGAPRTYEFEEALTLALVALSLGRS